MLPPPSLRVLAALVALAPAAALGAGRGLAHQKSIYADAVDAPLRRPEGVACDDRGNVVVADTGNARLLTYTWRAGILDGGAQVRLPQLSHPVRVQIDTKGFVLALDRRSRKIVKVDAKGGYAGVVEARGATSPLNVSAFKLDAADNVYALDPIARRVVVVAADGKVSRELPLPDAKGITDVAADSSGRVFVVDAVTAVVFVAEPGAAVFQPLTPSLKEMIGFAAYLAADRGKLYVVDQHGHAIVKLGADGSFQGRELGMGWGDGAVHYPGQLCIDGEGDVFVADRNNNRVQVFASPR